MIAGWIVLALVAAQRVSELIYARRNTRVLLARGGIERGAGHYPLFTLLHSAWLAAIALWLGLASDVGISWPLIGVYGVLQLLRLWVLWALGSRWTTRIITIPGEQLVTRGPYRWVKHPNYLVVCAEIAVLPLAFGAWPLALGFSLANAALLAHRIRVENAALAD